MNIRLILNLTRQDFRDRYAGSILGIFWALINPLVMITIYLLIFSEIMGAKLPGASNLDGFSIYLISGLLPWFAFSNTIVRTTSVAAAPTQVGPAMGRSGIGRVGGGAGGGETHRSS